MKFWKIILVLLLVLIVFCIGNTGQVFDWYQLKLMRVNTHIHTSYSQNSWYELYSLGHTIYSQGQSLDHITALNPHQTLAICQKMGVHPIFTDHCFKLKIDHYEDICKLANSSEFTCLQGFELTWLDDNHMNVIGSADMVTTNPENKQPGIKVCRNLDEFLDWLDNSPDNVIVCLNHPPYNLKNFREFKDLQNHPKIKLMEVNSRIPIRKGIKDNIPFYIKALQVGLKVAPVIGEDNFGVPGKNARVRYTGVWVHGRGPEALLDALNRRRVFASEDADIVIKFNAKPHDKNIWYLMGEVIDKPTQKVDFKFRIEEKDKAIGVVELVEVGKDLVKVVWTETTNKKTFFKRLTLKPTPETICYFILIKQLDGDWAVSAPVWVKGKEQETVSIEPKPLPQYKEYKLIKSIDLSKFGNVGTNSIALFKGNIIYMTDSGEYCSIVKITPSEDLIYKRHKLGEIIFKDYHKINAYKNKIILMVDAAYKKENNKIYRYIFYFTDGKIYRIGIGEGEKPGQYYIWNKPSIKFDQAGNIYISDNRPGFGRIQKFSPQGNFIKQVTNKTLSKLIWPTILFCHNDKLYVGVKKQSCGYGTRILVLDENLNFLEDKIIDPTIHYPHRASLGSGIKNACVDQKGNIYFLFHGGLWIKYDNKFKFVCYQKIYHSPSQILVDYGGKIYVLYGSTYGSRINIWEPIK